MDEKIQNSINELNDKVNENFFKNDDPPAEVTMTSESSVIVTSGTDPGIQENFFGNYSLNDDNRWGWITLYVVTIALAVFGNLFFVLACSVTRRSRHTGYYLLVSLSLRDIIVACLCAPFTLDYEIISLTWNFGTEMCISYRFFYHFSLAFLPLTAMFLCWHLFAENCKWNFVKEESGGFVPRPWPHTIYLPLIWFLAAAYAVPTAFFSQVAPKSHDLWRGNSTVASSVALSDQKVCYHAEGNYEVASWYFQVSSSLLTFCAPVVLLFIPWCALFIQVSACCTKKLRSTEFWLSLIALFLVLVYEASRAPFELFNVQLYLTRWMGLSEFAPMDEAYKAIMKWAIYASGMLHPFLYFAFSPEARHGLHVLCRRVCFCACCKKSPGDGETNSDDEKGKMLPPNTEHDIEDQNIPLQSTKEEEM